MSSVQVETRVVTSLSTGARASIVGALLLLLAALFFLISPIEQPTQAGPPFRCGTALAPAEGEFAASICAGQVRKQQLLAGTLGTAAVVLAAGAGLVVRSQAAYAAPRAARGRDVSSRRGAGASGEVTSAPDLTVAAPGRSDRPRSSTGTRGSLEYQPNLDGMRAVAVLLVMLYHGGVSWAHGGFLGVDIFFVLSGFLISTLLLRERARWGAIDIRSFWLRRARRLLPALFVMLAAVGLAAPLFARPDRLDQLRGDGFATLAYVANWRFIATGQSYFDQFAAPSPFRHMWSLGIEEQWYWLFPLLLVVLIAAARRRRRRLAGLLGALALASAVWMAWLAADGADPAYLYYATGTRVQELLVGSLLAVLVLDVRTRAGSGTTSRRVRFGAAETYVGAVGVVAVLIMATDTGTWLYRGGFLLFCLCVALLLDGLARAPASPVSRGLGWRPLVLVGVVSYGLYLWHWPLFLLLTPDRTGLGGLPLLALRFGVTGLAAAASYRLLERPIRSGALSDRFSAPAARGIVLASVVGVVAALMIGTAGGVEPSPVERSGAVETRLVTPTIGQQSVLVVGDSPGRFLSWYLPRDVLSGYALSSSTTIGCGLLPQTVVVGDTVTTPQPQCDGYFSEWQRAAAAAKPDLVVLSTGYWELFDKEVDGHVLRLGTPEYSAALLARLERVRTATTEGRVPLLLLNVPCMGQESFVVDGLSLEKVINDPGRQQQVNDVLTAFASRHPDVSVLDDRTLLCPRGTYQRELDGVEVRPDGVHVGGPGGRLVGDWLKPMLDRAVAKAGRLRTLVVGDSVAYSLVGGFDPRRTTGLQPWATTTLGCALDPYTEVVGSRRYDPGADCARARAAWPVDARTLRPDVALVIPGAAEMYDRAVDGGVASVGSDEFRAAFLAQIDRAVHDANAGTVAVVTAPCRRVPDSGTDPQAGVLNDAGRLATVNDLVRQYAADHPGVGLIDLDGYLCPHGYTDTVDGVALRTDGMHFSPAGAALVWGWLGPQVNGLASAVQATR